MLLVTHNNTFHADDLFSAATLKLIFPDADIVRTRDEKYFEIGDIVFDVGGKNDGVKNFDHHQYGNAGKRADGYPYAAFGLVWKKFGIELCKSQEIVDRIDESFVKHIDALDNGYNPNNDDLSLSVSEIVGLFNPNWNEEPRYDDNFLKALPTAQNIILRKIKKEESVILSRNIVKKSINEAVDKIVILDQYCNWEEEVVKTDALIVIYPESDKKRWRIRMVPKSFDSFENRISLKEEWRGKTREELFKLTGIDDFLFCHTSGFMGSSETKESAIKIAKLTISQ